MLIINQCNINQSKSRNNSLHDTNLCLLSRFSYCGVANFKKLTIKELRELFSDLISSGLYLFIPLLRKTKTSDKKSIMRKSSLTLPEDCRNSCERIDLRAI